jgi:hypothetical protein
MRNELSDTSTRPLSPLRSRTRLLGKRKVGTPWNEEPAVRSTGKLETFSRLLWCALFAVGHSISAEWPSKAGPGTIFRMRMR